MQRECDGGFGQEQAAKPLGPGAFGENLSVRGIDVSGAHVGALPFVRRFADAGRPGAYFGIAEDGDVGACDSVDAVARPDHDVSVGLVAHAVLRDRSRLTDVLAAAPARTWREWIEEQLADR